MLYDPKWQKTKRPSLHGLIAWLKTKDPRKRYNYMDVDGDCLLGQYFKSIGVSWRWWTPASAAYLRFDPIAEGRPHTFGAALKRAEDSL